MRAADIEYGRLPRPPLGRYECAESYLRLSGGSGDQPGGIRQGGTRRLGATVARIHRQAAAGLRIPTPCSAYCCGGSAGGCLRKPGQRCPPRRGGDNRAGRDRSPCLGGEPKLALARMCHRKLFKYFNHISIRSYSKWRAKLPPLRIKLRTVVACGEHRLVHPSSGASAQGGVISSSEETGSGDAGRKFVGPIFRPSSS